MPRTLEISKRIAWLNAPGKVLIYAQEKILDSDLETDLSIQDDPVTQLINGINIEFGAERFRYLRHPIMTNYTLRDWQKNLIKVCAKRYSEDECFERAILGANRSIQIGRSLTPPDESNILKQTIGKKLTKSEALNLVRQTSMQLRSRELEINRFNRDRKVVAILLDDQGTVLGATRNTNHRNQLLHAEVNLLATFKNQKKPQIPSGSSLVCSLKPCRMCASIFLYLCEDSASTQVIALEDDVGRFGRHSILGDLLRFPDPNEWPYKLDGHHHSH